MRDFGKVFEDMTRQALKKEGACFDRLPDQMSGKSGSQNPSDFTAYKKPYYYYIECKSCQQELFDIKTMITEHQWVTLLEKSEYTGVYAGYLIWFVGQGIRWVTAKKLDLFYRKQKKSFDYDELCMISVEVPSTTSKVNTVIDSLLPAIRKKVR